MQLLQERADNLEKKVLKYEQENQQLRSELDTLVACTRVCSNACVCIQYVCCVIGLSVCTFNAPCIQLDINPVVIFNSISSLIIQGKGTPDICWHNDWSSAEDSGTRSA